MIIILFMQTEIQKNQVIYTNAAHVGKCKNLH